MKKFIATSFVILLLLTLSLTDGIYAADYYVANGGSDNNSGTSINSPFATIQHAIDSTTAGDTVFVAAGTYNENITMKSWINVIGHDASDTIIEAPVAIVQGIVNFHDVDYAIFKNFTITIPPVLKQAGVDRGVVFDGMTGNYVALQNCMIYGVQYGIGVSAPAAPSIINNSLDGGLSDEQGISIGGYPSTFPVIIYNNVITGYNYAGINVYNGTKTPMPDIEYNDVYHNGTSPCDTCYAPAGNYVNYPDQTNLNGNISADPLFVNPANGDYHLGTGSPCIDGGFSIPEFLDMDGTRNDMGAYGGGVNNLIYVSKGGTGTGWVGQTGGAAPLPFTNNVELNCLSFCLGVRPYPDPCASCATYYPAGNPITLSAIPDPGSYFGGWYGATDAGTNKTTTQRYYLYYTPIGARFDKCTYSVTPASATFPYTGGNGVIYVTAPDGCVWNISTGSLPASMTITSAMSGTGNSTITYTISKNTSGLSYNTGFSLLQEGVNFNLTQDGDPNCTYVLSPASQDFSSAGGTGSIIVTTPAGCTWNAAVGSPGLFQPPYPWITITSGSNGSGSGTVNYTVAPSTDPVARTGWIGVAGQAVNINQACTFELNPDKAVLSASGGQYTVSVFASDRTCSWTAASNDTWLTITSGSSGTGNGTVTYRAAGNTGPARLGAITIAGQTLAVNQIDSSLEETIVTPSVSTAPGEPLWITATFSNNTGQTIQTIKPDCCNTYFWLTDEQGNMVPPRDRVCVPVGIPDSVVFLPPGNFTVTCDLSEMYSTETLTGTYKVMATYANYIQDPDYDPNTGECSNADRTTCYNLWSGAVPSAATAITIGGGVSGAAAFHKKMAIVGFNPLTWDAQWASVSGPAISAQISNIEGHVLSSVNDIDLSSILLNGGVPIIGGSAVVQDGVLTVKFDRSKAVQNLGSLVPGTTAAVTIQGSFASGTDIFYGQGSVNIVENTGTLIVESDLHTVGTGSQPNVAKAPIVAMETRVFDKQQGSCAAGYGISWQNYATIWSECAPVATAKTDVYGQALFALPQGDYLVIGSFHNTYAGVSVGAVDAGSIVDKYILVIQTADSNTLPAKYQKFTGSDLLVIEPEYVEWGGNQELYPFVFESSGDWSITTSVTPPEGFVADQTSLSTEVDSTLKALQFTVEDIGSKWVSTSVNHKIRHKGKTLDVNSKVGIKLTPGLANAKGLRQYGEEKYHEEIKR